MNQKMKSGRKVISYVLALVMVLSTLTGIVPGTSKTAYAAETWSSDQTISETQTISGGITVGADITLTINDGVTLTVNDGINADGHTLTVTGSGALIVKGARGNDGESYLDGDVGEYGIEGTLIVDGTTVEVTGGQGGNGGDSGYYWAGYGGKGGTGIYGDVTINSGSVTITGGQGGNGGYGSGNHDAGKGGTGGAGIDGNVTVLGGSIAMCGGNGGSGGESENRGNGQDGSPGTSVSGTITLGAGMKLYEGTDNTGTVLDSNISSRRAYSGDKEQSMHAEESAGYDVTITAGANMTKTTDSGDASQTVVPEETMTDVVYTADEGYYYPEDYAVDEVNGITVTRVDYTKIKVSGTPTADAAITLTAPTEKDEQDAPTTAAAVDCTTADNNNGKITGVTTEMEYQKLGDDTWTDGTGEDITDLGPGTYYVRYKETDTKKASDNQVLDIYNYFKAAKNAAIEFVGNVREDNYIEDDEDKVYSAKIAARRSIDSARTVEAVKTVLDTFKAAIADCMTKAEWQKQIDDVEKMINALPAADKVTLENGAAIEAARDAYKALRDDQKAEISQELLDKLESAEDIFEDLKEEAELEAELEEAKDLAIASLEKYAKEKALADATDAEKATYDEVVAKGKTAIKAAKDKDEVTAALKEAKKAVDEEIAKIIKDREEADKTNYSNEWVNGQWYDENGSASYTAKGQWKSDETGWWFEDSSGWYAKNEWIKIDGKWYYFIADGYMDYSEYRDGCWLGADGAWDTSYSGGHWSQDSKGWRYEDNGWYPVNQYLWIDGTKYWFGSDGYWK